MFLVDALGDSDAVAISFGDVGTSRFYRLHVLDYKLHLRTHAERL